MYKEISDILTAYREAELQGRKTALATVVHVEGSSYRRPGARMLVEDNGKITGAISGGCLEGDALKKALLAINQQQNKLVTYDTLHEDDIEFGVQLGCNGIVHILFEPIIPHQPGNPIFLLEKFLAKRENAVLATLFSLKNYHGQQPGTCFFFNGKETIINPLVNSLEHELLAEARQVLFSKTSVLKQYETHELTAFVELLQPPVSLIIIGAGNDALPLLEMATVLGWQITVVDGRPTHANYTRFKTAHKIIVAKPAESIQHLEFDERTFVVLMTHNYNYDLVILPLLLQQPCRYIGALGPKKRLLRMLAEMQAQNLAITDQQLSTIYGPIGLDIGAETSEEIALAVLSEIKAVLSGRAGTFLRHRNNGIHERVASEIPETN